jgi:hypothetical protein
VPATTIKSELVRPQSGSKSWAIRLTDRDGKPLTLDRLEVAHTEKIHLLAIDESVTDYHHLHPVAGDKPGEYRFDFAPRFGGTYHIWADLVPKATGKQEYSKATVKIEGPPPRPDDAGQNTATVDGYRFDLSMENNAPPRAGKATVVKIKVTGPDGREFRNLEPVMGAFAHMVAFPSDLAAVTHVHPMGPEPRTDSDRGGPELSFHIEPNMPGTQKLFLQTRIGGNDKFAAFVLPVEPAALTKAPAQATTTYTCPMHPEVVTDKAGKCAKCGMSLVAKSK